MASRSASTAPAPTPAPAPQPPAGRWRIPVWASALGWLVAGPGASLATYLYLVELEETVAPALGRAVAMGPAVWTEDQDGDAAARLPW